MPRPRRGCGAALPVAQVEDCNQYCLLANKAFTFFAVQHSTGCFCGFKYGSQGNAPESDCNTTCAGNAKETCGGADRNSVYKTMPLTREFDQ